MFVLDEITIIVLAVVVLVAITSPFVNLLMSRLKRQEREEDEEIETLNDDKLRPGISIVLTVDDEAEELRNNLPHLLKQKYDGDFQVIVVVCGNDTAVENTLQTYSDDTHLYTTFIPGSSRYMSRKKLALTVGVKAAKNEWIMMTDVNCRPASENWLAAISQGCSADKSLVLGFSSYEDDYKGTRRFDRTFTLYRQLASAQRGKTWAYSGKNLLFRKSMFISGKGFEGNLKYLRGEYDFIVNKFSDSFNTSVVLSPDSRIIETGPSNRLWRNGNMFYMATRKVLVSSLMPRILFNLSMIFMALGYILPLVVLVGSIMTERWVLTIAAAVSLIIVAVLRCVVLSKTVGRYVDEMSAFKMLLLEMTMPLRNFFRLLRYKHTDKYDFICHKV